MPFILKENSYFNIDGWEKEHNGLIAGFTTKNGGVSVGDFRSLNMGFHVGDLKEDVIRNRHILSKAIEMPASLWVGAEQTHEVNIRKITHNDVGRGSLDYEGAFKETDGFFTYNKDILLTLCFADCVPVFFVSPRQGAIGIAHAGWKGTVGGIAEEMVKIFQAESIPLEDIAVVIGPSICKKCYIVDERVISFVENRLEDVEEKPYNHIKDNQYSLDLKLLNKLILVKAGVLNKNIQVSSLCSCCDKAYFFSHRRDGGSTGRMMGYIGWKGENRNQ